ncbi:hypothetical protein HGM15179_012105 [Zosterops borbonicus]|uniref:Uncharacterized protein n=1 Tax=Zosterops borbonicus TaxID=364589 RepID=A0A8K1GBA4_9PASS|nr:hypothetical protein HGM15179_012105 [Zosterops borbonicus]
MINQGYAKSDGTLGIPDATFPENSSIHQALARELFKGKLPLKKTQEYIIQAKVDKESSLGENKEYKNWTPDDGIREWGRASAIETCPYVHPLSIPGLGLSFYRGFLCSQLCEK